jgi:6-phosphofructokinase 1
LFTVSNLGPSKYDSPMKGSVKFITENDRILYNPDLATFKNAIENGMVNPISIELAGPREKIFFEPSHTRAAIVTCGGLCPGLNNVVRALYFALLYRYGVKDVLGIQYGFSGFVKKYGFEPVKLTQDIVDEIHLASGSYLGSSRGKQEPKEIVDFIMQNKINILFCVGGDGTLRGAWEIATEAMANRGYPLSVVGIPKTIDNDISYISKSFGFDTAVHAATSAIEAAHAEAKGYYNGVGLVKIMGRQSGFIAAQTALACNDVNFVLIPESSFDIKGDKGFLKILFERLSRRHHAVVLVAEGAGQQYFEKEKLGTDASGNAKQGDIGLLLKQEILAYAKENHLECEVKYIDPSYMIRSTLVVSSDAIYCIQLAQNAVHAAMAGKTSIVIGNLHEHFTHVPIETAISKRKTVDVTNSLWTSVLEATGQPVSMRN